MKVQDVLQLDLWVANHQVELSDPKSRESIAVIATRASEDLACKVTPANMAAVMSHRGIETQRVSSDKRTIRRLEAELEGLRQTIEALTLRLEGRADGRAEQPDENNAASEQAIAAPSGAGGG